MRDTQDFFQTSFEFSAIPYQALDSSSCLLAVNQAWEIAFGRQGSEVIGLPFANFLEAQSSPAQPANIDQPQSDVPQKSVLTTINARTGLPFHFKLKEHIEWDIAGQHARTHCCLVDVSLQSEQHSSADKLTKFSGRLQTNSMIDQLLSQASQDQTKLALICLDIDDFKIVNEIYGSNVGDAVLEAVVEKIRTCLRPTDSVSCLFGDEFLIILPQVPDVKWVEEFCTRVMSALSEPFRMNRRQIRISASLGVSVYPENGKTSESLLLNAETALSNAKGIGKNISLFFKPGMKELIDRYAELSEKLQNALDQNQFVLHYQPQIDVKTGLVAGIEALIRWQNPNYGLQYPDSFIQIAERSGLIAPIGEWVLREACRQARQWELQGLPIGSISVNLSAIQFRRGNIAKLVAGILEETGLTPGLLVLELTESVLMHEEDLVMQAIDELRAIGIKLTIDDFGTGYSSMTYLKRFDVERLKIDKSFVMAMTKNDEDRSIVRSVIDLAASLGITSVAEGVENEETLILLISMGCDQVQGYFFSKPLTVSEFETYFR